MMFRYVLSALILVLGVNVSVLMHGAPANPIEKALLLLAGGIFLATRRLRADVLIIIAAILLTTSVTALFSSYMQLSLSRYIGSAFSLGVTFLLLAAEPTEEDRDTAIRMLTFLPILMVGLGIVYNVLGIRTLFYTDFLGASRLQGTSIPAGLGTAGYLGSVAAMLGAAMINKWKYLPLAIINAIILILSAARMPLVLAAVICAVTYFTMVNRSFVARFASLAMVVPLVGVFMLLFGESLLTRFESESLSGRDLLWTALQVVLDQYPLAGIGLGHQILVVPADVMFFAATMAAHNEYLRLAVETGYIGATIIFALLGLMCTLIWLRPAVRKSFVFVLMCLSFFVYCRTDNAISSTMTPLMLVLASFAFSCRLQVRKPALKPIAATMPPKRHGGLGPLPARRLTH